MSSSQLTRSLATVGGGRAGTDEGSPGGGGGGGPPKPGIGGGGGGGAGISLALDRMCLGSFVCYSGQEIYVIHGAYASTRV